MLDVFVVSLLAGLVRIQGFAEITAGVGIAAFGAVVVLTMLASLSFDPRLTWDTQDAREEAEAAARHDHRKRKNRMTRPKTTAPTRRRWPSPVVARRRNWLPSLIWLIPIVAALVGVTLVARILMERGPEIVLTFKTAEGLEAGKTAVKYKDVQIGTRAEHPPRQRPLARARAGAAQQGGRAASPPQDTRFWVVRPRARHLGHLGPRHLALGRLHRRRCRHLRGDRAASSPGSRRRRSSRATPRGGSSCCAPRDVGSLDIGSPVYFRRIKVGQLAAYELDGDGRGVTLRVFVNAPYDKFVGANTRFWHASGFDVQI